MHRALHSATTMQKRAGHHSVAGSLNFCEQKPAQSYILNAKVLCLMSELI